MGSADGHPALVRSPLGQGRLLLPTSSRADARAGLTLLNPNRPAATVAARLYDTWIAVVGPRAAGRPASGVPDILMAADGALLAGVVDTIGPVTGWAVIDPRQPDRPRAALLAVRDGVAVAFIKVNRNITELDRERSVLDRLISGGVNLRTPRVIGHGSVDGVGWMATTAMPSPRTRPMTELPAGWRTGQEFGSLEPLLGPRPSTDAVALHGDLTPWNLRRCAGEPWLLDWEDVGWGPPGADEAYFNATATAVCGSPLRPASPEATDHWIQVVRSRSGSGPEERLRLQLLDVLVRMGAPGAPPPSDRG